MQLLMHPQVYMIANPMALQQCEQITVPAGHHSGRQASRQLYPDSFLHMSAIHNVTGVPFNGA